MGKSAQDIRQDIDSLDTTKITYHNSISYRRFHSVAYHGVDNYLRDSKIRLQELIHWDDPAMVALFSPLAKDILDRLKVVQQMERYLGPYANNQELSATERQVDQLIANAYQFREIYLKSGLSVAKEEITKTTEDKVQLLQTNKEQLLSTINKISDEEDKLKQSEATVTLCAKKYYEVNEKLQCYRYTTPEPPEVNQLRVLCAQAFQDYQQAKMQHATLENSFDAPGCNNTIRLKLTLQVTKIDKQISELHKKIDDIQAIQENAEVYNKPR